FTQVEQEGARRGVSCHEARATITGTRVDEQQSSLAADFHEPAKMMTTGHAGDDVAAYMLEPHIQVAVQEARTVGVCSGIVHEQSDFAVANCGNESVKCVG